jgi:hypothetical protein
MHMMYLNIFLFLFAPIIVWWLTALALQWRGVRKNNSHAIGIGAGLLTLALVVSFIMQNSPRTLQ